MCVYVYTYICVLIGIMYVVCMCVYSPVCACVCMYTCAYRFVSLGTKRSTSISAEHLFLILHLCVPRLDVCTCACLLVCKAVCMLFFTSLKLITFIFW